ncbi:MULTISPECIES: HAD-IIB family hydrolase [Terrabacteria group]|uniref:HAD-IIB family hydrolase n=1 Tax=Bacillati TaxID=1783272 RepID=UPI001C6E4A48|nr:MULTISPECIES: HAD family hydrolase [Terrabacteria group]MBW9212188.1 Cof-type HAD-IIB family hydrolase [Trueperella sp. zg.1013]
MPKIIAIDLDGTLLDDEKKVSQANQKAIQTALNAGYQIYLCSGRPYAFVMKIKAQLDDRLNIVAFNGAYCQNEKKVKSVSLTYLDLIAIDQTIDDNAPCFFKSMDSVYYTHEDERFFYEGMAKKQINKIEDIKSCEILKVVILKQNKHAQALKDFVQVYEYGDAGMEISCKQVDKALHFQKNHYYAIGDGMNDLPLFKKAARSFAMSNGDKLLLEYADTIVSNNSHEGVAKAIAMILNLPH